MPSSPLALDMPTILFEIVNFLILGVLLYYFLFRPAMRNVRARAAERERLAREAAQDRDEAAWLRTELETRLARIDEEAAEVVARAEEQIEVERKAMLRTAEAEVERLLMEAHAEIGQVQQQAMDEFHDELLDAVLEVGGRVIGQTTPPVLHDALVQQLNDRIWELGRDEMRQVEAIRRSLAERTPTVYVASARPLSPDQQRELVRTFSALADRNVQLEVKTDSALTAGARVRIGDMIVDNSIRAQLDDLRAEVSRDFKERARGE